MKIGVLSRNGKLYSTKRLIEAGEKRGHEMYLIDHTKCFLTIEQDHPMVYYDEKKIDFLDAIIPRIGASVTFYGAAVIRQFEMMGVFTTLKSVALTRSRDKLRSIQILAKSNVGIPKSAFAKSTHDTKNLVKSVGGTPVIIKLLEGTQGLGVVLAETKKAAESVIEAFYSLDANMLVQEFIKEANGTDIRAFVVNNKVVGAMERKGVEGEFRSNLHRGGKSMAKRLTLKERKTALNAAKAMGLSVAGVDMLPSAKGPLVLEVNSSPGLEGIEKATKIDIADKIIEYIETNVQKNKKDKIGI
jgi:ribosomal protein S6--L-glutamate ligase